MKSFVSKEQMVIAVAGGMLLVLTAMTEPFKAAFFVFMVAFGSIFFRIVDNPPARLRRSRLWPMLRWWSLEGLEDPKAGSDAGRSRGSR